MADTKISALPAVSTVAVGDKFAVAQAGSSFAATAGQLTTYMQAWTYLQVSAAHFGTSSITRKDITGLTFIPGTNSSYEFEGCLMLKTSTTTANPRVAIRWPTACTSVGWINQAQSTVTQLMSFGNNVSSILTAVGALATTTGPWPAILGGVIKTFGATGSSFAVCLQSETDGVFVSSMIGSFVKYRVY